MKVPRVEGNPDVILFEQVTAMDWRRQFTAEEATHFTSRIKVLGSAFRILLDENETFSNAAERIVLNFCAAMVETHAPGEPRSIIVRGSWTPET